MYIVSNSKRYYKRGRQSYLKYLCNIRTYDILKVKECLGLFYILYHRVHHLLFYYDFPCFIRASVKLLFLRVYTRLSIQCSVWYSNLFQINQRASSVLLGVTLPHLHGLCMQFMDWRRMMCGGQPQIWAGWWDTRIYAMAHWCMALHLLCMKESLTALLIQEPISGNKLIILKLYSFFLHY